MTRLSRTHDAARLGLAALALSMQLAAPLATTSSAQTTPLPPSIPSSPILPSTAPGSTQVATTSDGPTTSTTPGTLQSRTTACADPGPADYPVAAGWFYTEQAHGCITGHGPARRRGYLVQDDDKGAFWTEFRRFGGLAVLGYPVSQPYHYPVQSTDGYWYQAFERGILQWQPENGRAVLANAFDQFSEQNLDDDLAVLGIPTPKQAADDSDRQSWLTEPLFLARYFFDPVAPHSSDPDRPGLTAFTSVDQAEIFFGVPRSMPDRLALVGPKRDDGSRLSLYPLTHSFMAQRFQKTGMELFFDASPKEAFGSPVWSDRPVFVDPTVVPGDARPGCVAITAVGLLARTLGSDKLIPSLATQPLPLDPDHAWVDAFIPPVSQGQLTTSVQLSGSGFKPNESVTITLSPVLAASQSGSAPVLVQPQTVSATTRADGSFEAVVANVRIGLYQLTATGVGKDSYVSQQPLDLSVSTVDNTLNRQSTCGPVGLPVAS